MIITDVTEKIYTSLCEKYTETAVIGYYPYDYNYIQMKKYAILIYPSDYSAYPNMATNTGDSIYQYNVNFNAIIYVSKDLDQNINDIMQFQSDVIKVISNTIMNYTSNLFLIQQIQVQTGDINNYPLPSKQD